MQDLSVVSVEHDALVLTAENGERFRVALDESVRAQLRRAGTAPQPGTKLTPREIQAHIRAGMSADDVAAITGTPIEYIQRFEGPVLAEREFIVQSALAVPVNTPLDPDVPEADGSFGSAIRARLAEAGAVGERWASWKEDGGGWIVKLAFAVERVDHDARWNFDPRRHTLSPANADALSLSQQQEMPRQLVPRLRAVEVKPEPVRFDSGAFQPITAEEYDDPRPLPKEIVRPSTGHTADLLEALRRRRGERETAAFADLEESKSKHPSTGAIRLVDVPLDGVAAETKTKPKPVAVPAPKPTRRDTAQLPAVPAKQRGSDGAGSQSKTGPLPTSATPTTRAPRKGRVSMPTWDEIVFGARPDDDLA